MDGEKTELERLQEWMAAKGLRSVDIARAIGWSDAWRYSYVSNMLSGSRPITDGLRLRLVLAYPETAQLVARNGMEHAQ